MEHLVSVITGLYNSSKTIVETVESVLSQTYESIEVILVDDGSKDDSCEVAERLCRADPRVRLLRNDRNRGIAWTLNAAARASAGAYIAPLDADDIWRPDKIARQVARIEACGPDYGFVYSPFQRIDAENRVLFSAPVVDIDGYGYLPHLVYNFVGNGSGLLIRREAFEQAGGYWRDRSAEGADDLYIQLAIARHWKIACAPSYLIGYRMSPGSVSSAQVKNARATQRVLEIIGEKFPETPQRVLVEKRAETWARYALNTLDAGKVGEGLSALGRSLRMDAGGFRYALSNFLKAKKSALASRLRGGGSPRRPGFWDAANDPDAVTPLKGSIAARLARAMEEERALRAGEWRGPAIAAS